MSPQSHQNDKLSRARGIKRSFVLGVAAVLALLAAAFLGTAWQVWNPPTDEAQSADAIVVLANHRDRRTLGRELASQSYSENLVQSVSYRMGEGLDDGTFEVVTPVELRRLQREGQELQPRQLEQCDATYPDYSVYCIYPDPDSTIGEAKALTHLAVDEGWDSVLLITERSHAWRTQRIFDRCFPGETHIVLADVEGNWWRPIRRTFYEVFANWKDFLAGGCG